MIDVGLPRAVAARVSVHGLATTQRVVVVIGALVGATLVVDVQLSRGLGESLPLLIAPSVGIVTLALLMLWRATILTATVYLIGGAILSVGLIVFGLAADPSFDEPGPYLLNRIATALCLVGAVSARAISGMIWTVVGFVIAQGSIVLGLTIAGAAIEPGTGPLIVASISFAAFATLALAQRQTDRGLAPLREAGQQVRGVDERRALERRAASVVHDTVLPDLTAISRTSGAMTERTRQVLAEHLAVVTRSSVGDIAAGSASGSAVGDALLDLAHEYQWSGVRVDVSGAQTLDAVVPAAVRHAVVGAVRAALDNVVSHAGTDRAELVAGIRNHRLTVLVVDDGVGFDPAEISTDRLGLRASITDRIQQVDGSVKLWSGPDGTTVMVSVPLPEPSP